MTTIGEDAFYGCSGLTSVTIPKSVTSIGEDAFYGCYFTMGSFVNNSELVSDSYWGATLCEEETTDGLLIRDGIVTKCRTWVTSITIPNNVTSIGYGAFAYCSGLTSVNIPESVTSIGENAFYGCSGLTSVTIPKSVTSMGDAFGYCTGLNSINVEPGNVVYDSRDNCNAIIHTETNRLITGCQNTIIPSNITSIGSCAFIGCSGLTSLYIPESVISIDYGAFAYCDGLRTINIPKGVTSIEYGTFYGCLSLTSIDIPEDVTVIDESAFAYCRNLTTINIPEKLTNIGNEAFLECNSLTSITFNCQEVGDWFKGLISIKEVTLGEKVTNIKEGAFSGCDSLTHVSINCSEVGYGWFRDMTSIKEVTLGVNVTSIGERAFSGCSGLTSINIPEGVTTIGYDAFSGCDNLTYLSINCSEVGGWFSGMSSIKEVTLGENVTTIGNWAFSDCVNLTSVSINCPEIGYGWFRGLTSIKEVTLGENVTTIGDDAFSGCSGLTSLTIAEGVTSITEGAFYGCGGLTSINVSKGNTVYDSRDNCNAIIHTATHRLIKGCQNTIIPSNITAIGGGAFSGCSGLTSINIPNGVTSIDNQAFSGCSGLTSITIPKGVTSIGGFAFYYCSSLASINIPESINSMGDYAFYGTAWYESQPSGMVYIGDWAVAYKGIYDLPSNTTIALKEGTKGIADCAFNDKGHCENLIAVIFPESLETIGYHAFYYCPNLRTIYSLSSRVPSAEDAFEEEECPQYTLYAPKPALSRYGNTEPWRFFGFIKPLPNDFAVHSITYLVNGEEYLVIPCIAGDYVYPQPSPQKEDEYGYIEEGWSFSGWKGQPDKMPDHDVTVTGYLSSYVRDMSSIIKNAKCDDYDDDDNIVGWDYWGYDIPDDDWSSPTWHIEYSYFGYDSGFNGSSIQRKVSPGKCLGDGELSQTIKGLPTGRYGVSAEIVACQQENETGKERGAYLFVESGAVRDSVSTFTTSRSGYYLDEPKPEHYAIEIDVTNGRLTIGFETVNCQFNWVAVDNWKLYYVSPQVSVNAVKADETEGETAIYNLQGQRLTAPKKGLNIINGRKVMVK